MTTDAQSALRRTMETFSKTTRFCLICNYVSRLVDVHTVCSIAPCPTNTASFRIIDPLASRCAKFRFKPLDEGSASARIKYICAEENIAYSEDVRKL
jgi:DNA polymerase III delta prime subunit